MTQMNPTQLQTFLDGHFPDSGVQVLEVGQRCATIALPIGRQHLRPGGTVAGPVMMSLADTAMYMAILAELGPVAMAVTTNLNINFLRKPDPVDLIAKAELFKLGKRLAMGEVKIYSRGSDDMVAHATCTYSIPPG